MSDLITSVVELLSKAKFQQDLNWHIGYTTDPQIAREDIKWFVPELENTLFFWSYRCSTQKEAETIVRYFSQESPIGQPMSHTLNVVVDRPHHYVYICTGPR